MSFFKNQILTKYANFLGTKRLIKKSQEKLVNVFYHTVSDEYLPHISPLYRIKKIKEFKEDLDYLLKHFQPVSMEEVLLKHNSGESFSKPSFNLSFDDGLGEVYTTIYPILKAKGIPATLFVNSGFVDNKDLFYRYKASILVNEINNKNQDESSNLKLRKQLAGSCSHADCLTEGILKVSYHERNKLDEMANVLNVDFKDYLRTHKPYLSTDELRELQQNGFTIGGHSVDHPFYAEIDYKEQIRQTSQSVEFVKSTFDEKNSFFAFPFSDLELKSEFYNEIYNFVDISYGVSGIKREYSGRNLHRIDMEKDSLQAKSSVNKAFLTNILKSKVK